MRAYVLRQVIPPPHPPAGRLRPAALEDLETLLPWRVAFYRESLNEEAPDDLRDEVIRQISGGAVAVWEDKALVSTAVKSRPTPHGASIGAVYTPLEFRGRGYASACVAALSQQILDSGKTFCTLFTDLDYPTSNSIYQKIGYQPVCDFYVLHF
jgi:predicted GNAT family acetyltransferase